MEEQTKATLESIQPVVFWNDFEERTEKHLGRLSMAEKATNNTSLLALLLILPLGLLHLLDNIIPRACEHVETSRLLMFVIYSQKGLKIPGYLQVNEHEFTRSIGSMRLNLRRFLGPHLEALVIPCARHSECGLCLVDSKIIVYAELGFIIHLRP